MNINIRTNFKLLIKMAMADCGSNVEMEMVIDDDTSGRDADEE